MATPRTMRGHRRGTALPPGLQAANFRKIAPNGLGDPHNTYPHAMTWFGGRLYVSTTRDNLVFPKLRYPFEIPLSCWPVRLPQDLWDLDLRAQIWRYDPAADRWSMVHAAPLERGREGRQVPSCIAYRAMAVFRSRHDTAAALYAPTFAPLLLGRGSAIVRSYDGEEYEVGPEPGLAVGNGRFRSFRTLKAFGDRLFTAPTMGDAVGRPNQAGVAVVLVTTDPFRDGWRVANEPSFGDPGNLTVFDLAVCAGRLYAGTMNVQRGFQVWKTDAAGPPPFRWVKVLDRGAGRGQFNQGAITMVPFRGSLYIAAAVQNGGFDRVHGIGPVAAELLRLHPDDTWDLIAGEPRLTEQGLKPPLSGMGSGFNNPFAGYFWQMCEHDGWLYLGTFDSSAFLPFHPMEKAPAPFRNALETIGVETFLNRFGGFDLWRTRDGVRWTRVTSNGFGNPYNYGVRTMASTPHGLFLGATNPFGPEVAVRRAGGWVYEANPRGGLEIWL
ncbi:MAG TPA: NAD(P)-dependent oxidoreductase, partial [Candidatus Polarisedimenticolia bacterium]|nr:NAD(P)-dependent oxidoreductase [Candidatus Polarisedimenticolia bacterium]